MELSATIIIIAITVLASFYAWNNASIMENWNFNPYSIHKRNQYHRFVTSAFIHNDYMHLFFNMFTFYFFGTSIEAKFTYYFGTVGVGLFVIFYVLAIVVADLPTYLKYKNSPHYNALGASGGVSAIVFSWILFFPTQYIYIMAILPLPGFVLGILFVIYSYYQGKKEGSRINHDAHLYGAVFGLIFTLLVIPDVFDHFIRQVTSLF